MAGLALTARRSLARVTPTAAPLRFAPPHWWGLGQPDWFLVFCMGAQWETNNKGRRGSNRRGGLVVLIM